MEAWDQTNITHNLTTFPSPLTPLFGNPDSQPGTITKAFTAWHSTECRALGHLFDLDGIISFPQLRQDYGLPEAERLCYLQLRHWALHPQVQPKAECRLTTYKKWLITRTSDKKLISDLTKCYSRKTNTQRRACALGAGTR